MQKFLAGNLLLPHGHRLTQFIITVLLAGTVVILLINNDMIIIPTEYITSVLHLDSMHNDTTFTLLRMIYPSMSRGELEQTIRTIKNDYNELLSYKGKYAPEHRTNHDQLDRNKLLKPEQQRDQMNSTARPFLCIISPHPNVRFGNKLFMYASTFGLAKQHGHQVIAGAHFEIVKELFPNIMVNARLTANLTLKNDKHAVYRHIVVPPQNACAKAYLQSWRYFWKYREELRHHLVFNRTIIGKVMRNLSYLLLNVASAYNVHHTNITLVGIHVRGNDMRSLTNQNMGFCSPHTSYFAKAMLYFTQKYSHCHFVIVTDDVKWSREIFARLSPLLHTFYTDIAGTATTRDVEDLAVLSGCRHVIGSVGTYSWWGAWLAGGEVVMYNHPVLPRSNVGIGFLAEDFFPPEWNLIGD